MKRFRRATGAPRDSFKVKDLATSDIKLPMTDHSGPRGRWALLAFLLAPSLSLGGCLPYVTPPAKVTIAGAAQKDFGVQEPSPASEEEEAGAEPAESTNEGQGNYMVRLGVLPLSLVPSLSNRSFDVSAGLLLEEYKGREQAVGGYLGSSHYFVRHKPSDDQVLRVGVSPTLDILGSPGFGYGGTVSTTLQWNLLLHPAATYSGSDEDGAYAGIAYGEFGLGVVLGGGYRHFTDEHPIGSHNQAVLFGGVTLTIPLLAGVICCALPGGDDDDDE